MSRPDDDIASRREEFNDLGAGLGGTPPSAPYGAPSYQSDWSYSDPQQQGSGMRPTAAPVPREQWKGRRRMAWIALFATLVVTSLAIFYIPLERIGPLTDIIMWFFVTMGSIIGSYMGFTAWWATRSNNRS